ncbi:MAG: sigma factor-like helix-turn-helix DNA-binding protein [Actinomycetota bacterium]
MTVAEVRSDAVPGFDEFVAAEGAGLLRLAFLLTTETEPAVAALEDALARTYGAWPRLAASGHPQDYVRRALVHEATETHRLRRTHASTVIDLTVEDGPDDDLVRALRALPPDERAATVLRHCLDLSEMETAATLGCTVGAVRRQTMRALSQLRVLLPGLAPAARPAAHSMVELMRHLQASLGGLPDRLDLRPAPELLRNIRRTHARRTLRRRTAVVALAAGFLLVVAVILLSGSAVSAFLTA